MKKRASNMVKYKNLTDNLCVSLSFYVFSLLFEFFSCLLIFGHFPTYIYISIAIIHIFSFVIFLLPTKALRRIIAIIFLSFQLIICVTNDILYRVTGEIFTFDKLVLAGEAMGTFTFSMINILNVLIYFLIFIFSMFCMCGLPKFFKKFQANKKQFSCLIVSFLFSFVAVFGCVSSNYLQKRELFLTEYSSTLALSTFGHYGFYPVNFFKVLNLLKPNHKIEDEEYQTYLNYFKSGTISPETNFSGVSEGNNVIVILAESIDEMAIDPYFTPNLYKMWFEDGMYLKNYHSENKTNMSEGMALFGNYGREKQLINYTSLAPTMSLFSFAQKLKNSDENIQTTYAHSFRSTFYNRQTTHSQIGFDKLIFGDLEEDEIKEYNAQTGQEYDFNVKVGLNNYLKDSNFFEYNKETLIPESRRFFTSFSTMVTHGEYLERGSNKEYLEILTSESNRDYFDDMIEIMNEKGYDITPVYDKFLYYKAAVMDFDKMVGMIFDRLESLNILDKTTIYMFPDHNAYYDNLSFLVRGISLQDVRKCNVQAYNMGACIYDQKLIKAYKGESEYNGGVTVEKFTSVNDIYPTLCDILNISYNSNLCYGKSLFLDEDRLFISLKDDRYIFNDKYYYYDGNVYDNKTRQKTSNEQFEQELEKLLYKFGVLEKLYKSQNYFDNILKEISH